MFRIFDGASGPLAIISRKSDEASNKILKASGSTDKLNSKLEATGASANTASSGLGKFLSITAAIAGAVKGMSIADEFMNTSARLNLINDGLQTQAELQEKIFQAADRSRGSYTDMAAAVAKLGIVAKDAFGSNDETIAFTELLQKSMKVGGASGTEQSSAMLQLAQAMGSGALKGDEFNSISENAPLILEAVARYTRKSRGELKELASDGAITADIIKNAMFAMSDEINTQFKTMPMTFADVWNKIKNGALKAFEPIIQVVSNLINSAAFNDFVNGFLIGVNLISTGIGGLIGFISDNWPVIQALLLATGIYLAATLGPAFVTAGWLGLKAGMDIAAGWIMTNLPMLAIIATIGMIIYTLGQMGVTFEDIFGFIGGVVGVAIAGIYNLFLGLFDLVLGILNYWVNNFVTFTNFLGNVFTSPISSVIYLFQGMADSVLGVIEKIASAMDFVFGSKMADTVSSWRSGLKEMADAAVSKYAPNENYKKIMDPVDLSASDFGFERMDYSNSWDKGKKIGKDAYGGASSAISKLTDSLTGTGKDNSLGDFGKGSSPIAVEGKGKNKNVEVDMADEDLQYLRDIAERDYINKFSTATLAPNVQFTFGDVHETADANKLKGTLEMMMREEIAVAAEGVY